MEKGNKKFCPNCNTEYLSEYMFCKTCGAPLQVLGSASQMAVSSEELTEESVKEDISQASEEIVADSLIENEINVEQPSFESGNQNNNEDYIDNVPTEIIADYIGNKSDDYILKFKKYSKGSKAGWNWPVFLFGYLLNLPFVWFFYRKMYMIGTFFLAISIALVAGTAYTATTMVETIGETAEKQVKALTDEIEEIEDRYGLLVEPQGMNKKLLDEEKEEKIEKAIDKAIMSFGKELATDDEFMKVTVILSFISIINLAYIILTAIFANYLYYKKVLSSIGKLGSQGALSPGVIKLSGGVNSAAGAVTGVFGSIASMAVMFIPVYFAVIDIALKIIDFVEKNM